MFKFKKLRRLGYIQEYLSNEYSLKVSRYNLELLYINNKVSGFKNGNTYYLFLEDVLNYYLEKGAIKCLIV